MQTISMPWVLFWVSVALVHPPLANGQAPANPPAPALTLERAVDLALRNSFALAAVRAEVEAARGRLVQAGTRHNPALSLEAENFSGSAPGFSGSELTLRGDQRLELGGKRTARTAFARAEVRVAERTAEAESVAVRAEVRRRFAEAQVAVSETELASQFLAIGREFAEAVARKVQAGAVSPAESARAGVELANAKLELSQSGALASLAETRLASLWGERSLGGLVLAPIPESLPQVPDRDSLAPAVLEASGIRALDSRVDAAEKHVALQRSLRMPDLDIGAGVRTNRATDQESFVAGVSLPLPIFNRNAGNVAAAAAELARAQAALALASRERLLALDEVLVALARARERREVLQSEVLPGAQRAHEEVLTAYRRGRFSYVDVLDSRRSLLAASRASLEAYAAYATAEATLEVLLGGAPDPRNSEAKE